MSPKKPKRVQMPVKKQDTQPGPTQAERRSLTSMSKSARKLRKDVIEQDFGHLPIR